MLGGPIDGAASGYNVGPPHQHSVHGSDLMQPHSAMVPTKMGYNSLPPYAMAQFGAFNYPQYSQPPPSHGLPHAPSHPASQSQQQPLSSHYPTTLPNFGASIKGGGAYGAPQG